ncbi:MAG: hypothetical protein HJJLKODD_02848 [Phycisphaerae bacterium]|nr:hypothetical protein [Phycisphaerae bacterium]
MNKYTVQLLSIIWLLSFSPSILNAQPDEGITPPSNFTYNYPIFHYRLAGLVWNDMGLALIVQLEAEDALILITIPKCAFTEDQQLILRSSYSADEFGNINYEDGNSIRVECEGNIDSCIAYITKPSDYPEVYQSNSNMSALIASPSDVETEIIAVDSTTG